LPVRILFIGEIVSKAGIHCVKTVLQDLRKEADLDFVIANGDGATSGYGIGKNHSIYLRKLGVDVITGGDQTFFKKDMVPHLQQASYILRPANLPPQSPGRGYSYYTVGTRTVGVISLLGQSGFHRIHGSNPFTFLPQLVQRLNEHTPIIVVDFHALTTAEKYSMFYHADGMVSAVLGTGTRVSTGDHQILPKGTAVMCDVGRTGSVDSVAGLDAKVEIRQFLSMIPERSSDTWERPEFQGVILEIDDDGKAVKIEPFRKRCEKGQREAAGVDSED
jgi:hypothetical protein